MRMPRTAVKHAVKTIAAYVLARASAAMMLAYLSGCILASAPDDSKSIQYDKQCKHEIVMNMRCR